MGLERYVVDAVLIEKRSPTEIAKAHGISRSWLYALIARVRGGGYEAVNLLVAGAQVRIVTEQGELLRALTIDPTRDYQPLNGRWPVHNVLRQASGIS